MSSLPVVSGDLAMLLQDKSEACLSMVLPLPHTGYDDWKTVLVKASRELQMNLPNQAASYMVSLEQMLREAQQEKSTSGIGLYVSEHIAQKISFPFPVQEKIIIDRQFHVRELLYKNQYAHSYLLLQLGPSIRLYAGRFRELEEIKDGIFPIQLKHPGESNDRSGRDNLAAAIDYRKIQALSLPLEIDNRLGEYFREDTVLVVCGDHGLSASFLNNSRHADKLIGAVHGNYREADVNVLASAVWPTVKGWLEDKMEASVSAFSEKIGEGRTVSGLTGTWSALYEERGLRLLVEKDYQEPGYLEQASYMLYRRPPQRTHRMLQDAVDALIPVAFSKKVAVTIVGNGMLEEHGHIALITRY